MKIYSVILLCAFSAFFELMACQSHTNQGRKNEVDKNGILDSAHFFFDNGKFLQALKYYNVLIKNDSMQNAYYYERGTCKLYEFDSLGALFDYRRAELLNYPKKNYLYQNMAALFLFDFGKYDSAIYYYNAVLKQEPNNEKAMKGKAIAIDLKDKKKP